MSHKGDSRVHPYLLIIISILLGAFAQIVMKLGSSQAVSDGLSICAQLLRYFTNLPILMGFLLYTLSAVLWIFAISRVQLSVAYPMVALSYVLVVFLSYLFFHEPVSALRILGLGVIVIGVVIIANS